MYPLADLEVDSTIPANASYWVPKPSEITDEGFGYFRDVWPILDAPTKEVQALLAWEREAAAFAAKQAGAEEEFDSFAKVIEEYSPDFDDTEYSFPPELWAGWTGLGGLELGVAGLTYSLANSGFYPAASCRTHPDSHWATAPVVIFASDRTRLAKLQPLVAATGCDLSADGSRGHPLFAVQGRSVVNLMDLAEELFKARSEFRKLPKTDRKQRNDRSRRMKQAALFPEHPSPEAAKAWLL